MYHNLRHSAAAKYLQGAGYSRVYYSVYNTCMLPELQKNDVVRMRKPHPCGSFEWTVTRLGADIGLECKGCGRRVMLTRRELARRAKTILPCERQANEQST